MKKTTFIFLLILSVANFNLKAQISVKANSGSMEEFMPWQGGYFGVAHRLTYAVVSKFRRLQYYDAKGNFKWEKTVYPYNYANQVVLSENSKYAYFINKAYTKTAKLEKKSSTVFLNIHQIDVNGKLKLKTITYKNEFECLKGGEFGLFIKYMSSNNDGITLITSDPQNKGESYLFTISSNFEVKKIKLGFDWNRKDWEDGKISKLNFSEQSDTLSIIQVKHLNNKLQFIVETYNLSNLKEFKVGKSYYKLTEKAIGHLQTKMVLSSYALNNVTYSESYYQGESYVTAYKLGSTFDYTYTNGKLLALASTYKSNDYVKKGDPSGFCYFELVLDKIDVPVNEIKYVKFQNCTDKNKVYESYVLFDKSMTYIVKYKKTGYHSSVDIGKEQYIAKKNVNGLNAMGRAMKIISDKNFTPFTTMYQTEQYLLFMHKSSPNAAGGSKKVSISKVKNR